MSKTLEQAARELLGRIACGPVTWQSPEVHALRDALSADTVSVPREPTEAMIDAYLKANAQYWCEVDELVPPIGTWRPGSPQEATRVSYRAALAAHEKEPKNGS